MAPDGSANTPLLWRTPHPDGLEGWIAKHTEGSPSSTRTVTALWERSDGLVRMLILYRGISLQMSQLLRGLLPEDFKR